MNKKGLKTIKMQTNKNEAEWMSWCSLCANKHDDSGAALFYNNYASSDMKFNFADKESQVYSSEKNVMLDLVDLVGKLTDFLLSFANPKTFRMCFACELRLEQLSQYMDHVKKVQEMYKELIQNQNNDNALENWSFTVQKYFPCNEADDEASSVDVLNSNLPNELSKTTVEHEDPLWLATAETTQPQANEKTFVEKKIKLEQRHDKSKNDISKKSETFFNVNEAMISSHSEEYLTESESEQYLMKCDSDDEIIVASEPESDEELTDKAALNDYIAEVIRDRRYKKPTEVKRTRIKNDNRCKLCEKKFSSANGLKKHVKYVHLDMRDYVCNICGLGIKTNYKEHMITHNKECKYKCEQCGKSYKSPLLLKTHQQKHNTEKYACHICGKKYSFESSLRLHKNMHTDRKERFKCPYCPQCFISPTPFKIHLTIHFGLKPHECNICNYKFGCLSTARKHVRKVHKCNNVEERISSSAVPSLEQLIELTKKPDNIIYPVICTRKQRVTDEDATKIKYERIDE